MTRSLIQFLSLTLIAVFVSGCATTRAKRAETKEDPQSRIVDLQTQLQAKDQEIQELRYQLDNRSTAATNFNTGTETDKYNLLRVSGVTVTEVQKALLKAGFDPGAIDGRLGKKTRLAIKQFQKRHNLTADGVVGEKTWSALKAY